MIIEEFMVLLGLPELVLCCPKLLQACRACFGQPKTSKGIPNLVLCYPKLLQACWACFEQPKTITGLPEPILCCPKLLQACMSLVYVALPTTFTGLLEPILASQTVTGLSDLLRACMLVPRKTCLHVVFTVSGLYVPGHILYGHLGKHTCCCHVVLWNLLEACLLLCCSTALTIVIAICGSITHPEIQISEPTYWLSKVSDLVNILKFRKTKSWKTNLSFVLCCLSLNLLLTSFVVLGIPTSPLVMLPSWYVHTISL